MRLIDQTYRPGLIFDVKTYGHPDVSMR